MRLPLQWAAMETIARPNYNDGIQLLENDALASVLEDLRKAGRIDIPDWCKHIPPVSRFGVSPQEVGGPIAARVAEIGKVDKQNVDVPTYAAFNYFGNLAHPEFGETDTWEVLADALRDGGCLIGGCRGIGGLSCVDWHPRDRRGDLAFRFRVVFPSSKS